MNKNINLTAAELKAIHENMDRMKNTLGHEVSIEDAVDDFLLNYEKQWRADKQRRDNEEQIREIEKHKYFRSMEEKRDIGIDHATREWSERYAHIWRAERESLERNGFERIVVCVANRRGLHVRPSSRLTQLVVNYNCEVYVSKPGMHYFNFVINGRRYMNIRSILGFLSLGIVYEDELEFIAIGPDAREALRAIREFVGREFDYEHPGPGDFTI